MLDTKRQDFGIAFVKIKISQPPTSPIHNIIIKYSRYVVQINKENYGFPNFHTSNNHLKTGFSQKYQLKCFYITLIML